MDTTWMIEAACDADRQPSYARYLMMIEDCVDEYDEYMKKAALAEATNPKENTTISLIISQVR